MGNGESDSHVITPATVPESTTASRPEERRTWTAPKLAEAIDSSVMAQKRWNTKDLPYRIGADAASAAAAGVLVAPLISIVDRGIIENSSGRNTLGQSVKESFKRLVFRPHRFFFAKPFALIFCVYGGTYLTANTIDTVTSTLRNKRADNVTAGPSKFVATSTANLTLGIFKDSQFTKMFGAVGQAPRPIPKPTYALFAIRDCLTIFASFNVPPILAPKLQQYMSAGIEKNMSSYSAAQFLAPAAVQILSTPFHLLGLDLYNREKVDMKERLRKVVREWPVSFCARICRIVPAFGFGGVVNTAVRKNLMGRLD